jgi:hypothetical protein
VQIGSSPYGPGVGGDQYDIYTGYEYDMMSGGFYAQFFKLDRLNSTVDQLQLRIYTLSWGMDGLIMRFMEAANLTGSFGRMESTWSDLMYGPGITKLTNRGPFQDYGEGMRLEASIGPNMCNMSYEQTCQYHMTAWEDPSSGVFSSAWMLEMMHFDYVGNCIVPWPHMGYQTPFRVYDPDFYNSLGEPQVTRLSLAPGTTHYGLNVSYWIAPMARNLSQYETLIVSLDTGGRDVIGIKPFRSANDTLKWRLPELKANFTWGRLALGDGCVPRTEIRNGYDPITKTITLVGPLTMPLVYNDDYWDDEQVTGSRIYTHGVPMFIFDVVAVDHYDVTLTGPHMTGQKDEVRVTAKNASGATVTGWNSTVDLTCTDADASFDSSSHTYDPSKNGGVWITNVTWGVAPGNYWVNATDSAWDLDLKGSSGFTTVIIPEFTTILIPIVGMMAVFFVFRSRKKKSLASQS